MATTAHLLTYDDLLMLPAGDVADTPAPVDQCRAHAPGADVDRKIGVAGHGERRTLASACQANCTHVGMKTCSVTDPPRVRPSTSSG